MNTAVAVALPARSERCDFYLWMTGAFVCVAFGGFIPTFWAKVAAGTFHAAPMICVHGALFFTWTLFCFMQTALRTRKRSHPVYVLRGAALLAQQVLTVPFAATATWMSMAAAFERLAG